MTQLYPSVEQAIGRDRVRKALERYENKAQPWNTAGQVRAVNSDGSFEVLLPGDVQPVRCGNYCSANVGDVVAVVRRTDGKCDAIGRLGGEIGGGGSTVVTYDDVSNYIAGRVFAYAGTDEPIGALLCDGRAVSRTTYWELFAAIGTTYGAGDGSTTFNLPNIESRTIIGESDSYALGSTGGQESVDLSAAIGAVNDNTGALGYIAEGPSSYQWANVANLAFAASPISYDHWNHSVPVTEHGNANRGTSLMQPYIVMRYFITTGKGDPVSGVNPADYVVEWGVDDFWTWFKYASGKAECWNTHENVITFPAGSSVTNHNLPFQFADNDYRVYTYKSTAPGYSSSQIEHITITPTSEGVAGFVLENWNAHTEQRVFSVSIEVIGRWKEMSESGGTESIAPTIAERFEGIESEIDLLRTNKVLWSGAWVMNQYQTATLSEAISAQPNGVVLAFSFYDLPSSTAQDNSWNYHFIPKNHALNHNGDAVAVGLVDNNVYHMTKYLYVGDTGITGHSVNDTTATYSGVTTYRSNWVLREVIGV